MFRCSQRSKADGSSQEAGSVNVDGGWRTRLPYQRDWSGLGKLMKLRNIWWQLPITGPTVAKASCQLWQIQTSEEWSTRQHFPRYSDIVESLAHSTIQKRDPGGWGVACNVRTWGGRSSFVCQSEGRQSCFFASFCFLVVHTCHFTSSTLISSISLNVPQGRDKTSAPTRTAQQCKCRKSCFGNHNLTHASRAS